MGLLLYTGLSRSEIIEFNKIENRNSSTLQIITDITQTNDGLIWFATYSEGLYQYDGYNLKSIKLSSPSKPHIIKDIQAAGDGGLWVATQENGAYYYLNGLAKPFQSTSDQNSSILSNRVSALLEDSEGGFWFGTDKGISYLTTTDKFQHFPFPQDLKDTQVSDIKTFDEGIIWLGTNHGLIKLNIKNGQYDIITLTDNHAKIVTNVIHNTNDETLLLGTNKGLIKFNQSDLTFSSYLQDSIDKKVTSIVEDNDNYWIGTLYDGLFKINKHNQTISNHIHNPNHQASLSDNNIYSMYIDHSNVLWLGTFNSGVNFLALNNLAFGYKTNLPGGFDCSPNKVIHNIYEDKDKTLWLSTETGVIKYNPDNQICNHLGHQPNDENTFSYPFIYEAVIGENETLWVSTARGLNRLDTKNNQVDRLTNQLPATNTSFSMAFNKQERLVGTKKGLYRFHTTKNTSTKILPEEDKYADIYFYDYAIDNNDRYYFATDRGVFLLTDNRYSIIKPIADSIENAEVLSLYIDEINRIWVGTYLNGLFLFGPNHNLIVRYGDKHGINANTTVNSILYHKPNIWLGTNQGLVRLNTDLNQAKTYLSNDGLQGDFFNKSSAFKGPTEVLYFGGRNGYNAVVPEQLIENSQPPKTILTKLTRFNTEIMPNRYYDDFSINQPINSLSELTLSHKDYVIGFEFAALDYADPLRNKYAYQLEGFDPDWNHTNANNRQATYTNLPRGNYTFRVKAANKDGVWNEQGVSLKIKVLPAPWLSWWAISLYVLMLLSLAAWIINRKMRANQVLAQLLQQEVNEKTTELLLQKQKVETLLAKKNELFSNVSHEFRTPLTLIIGPMQELIEESQTTKSRQTLTVLKRNANRLLSLVEQLLQLAKTSDFKKAKLSEQETSQQISAIVESFQHLAQDKKINLKLQTNEQAFIKATDQCLDATLGNLISNAIKYSPTGVDVVVSSELHQNQLMIRVKDEGAGLSTQQQLDVFKRFERLDAHQNIEGIGIGLAVAKELTEINQGTIEVESEPGAGSQFTITLPVIVNPNNLTDKDHQPGTLIEQLTKNEEPAAAANYKNELVNNKNIVLVIEDNHDMRNHIVSVLQAEYHCLQAKNGKEGVANAIKYIPDLIICDVMMPEMDGFKVSRVIRSDQRTSHIPLILLTALNDRENRIKGWREHVDVYMTKPFDREELLIQVENIITIRNILKKKARLKISKNKTPHHSDLPKRDFEFVEKLIKAIHNNYQDPQLNRDTLASIMAVSDRQLQRKIKALIDQNPMDMLREYRLKMAAEKLKDGYQVGQSSDDVGFKTPTHFSQCFKAQYGLTPKQYQQQFKKNNFS